MQAIQKKNEKVPENPIQQEYNKKLSELTKMIEEQKQKSREEIIGKDEQIVRLIEHLKNEIA